MAEVRGTPSCNSLNSDKALLKAVESTTKLDHIDMERSSLTSEDDTMSEFGSYKKSSSWRKFGKLFIDVMDYTALVSF